jgi:tRNA-binding EMAP/Myf-like protein
VHLQTEAQQTQAQSVAAPLEANVARVSTSAEKEATKQAAPKKKQEKAPKQPPKPAVSRDPFEDAALQVRDHHLNQIRCTLLILRRWVQVARVQVVEHHPDADSLYVCQVALGEETRQLVPTPSTFPPP